MPSESASFPDLLGRGLDASKKSKWRLPAADDVASRADLSPSPAPAQPTAPADASQPSNGFEAAPAPANQWEMASDPLSPGTLAQVTSPPIPVFGFEAPPPPAAAAVASPNAPAAVEPRQVPSLRFQPAPLPKDPEQFGFPEATVSWPSLVRRRRYRSIRFIIYELIAIAVLVFCALESLAHRGMDDPLSLVTKILTITSAIVAVVIPILFYGLPETLPRR